MKPSPVYVIEEDSVTGIFTAHCGDDIRTFENWMKLCAWMLARDGSVIYRFAKPSRCAEHADIHAR